MTANLLFDAVLQPLVIRAVGFDLDDTLAVTSTDRKTLLREAAADAEIELSFGREEYRKAHDEYSGTASREPVFEALVGDDASAMARAYRDAVGTALEAVPSAADTVARLRGRYRVGVLTDGPDDTQRDKLHRLGWHDAFDAVVTTGTLDAPKPDGRTFRELCAALDADPSETVYVGDNPERDIAGAAAAGLVPVQVMYGGGPSAHPDAVAAIPRTELGSLPGLIDSLGGDSSDDR